MKCKYCGGEVGLEQPYCPYCGRPNEQAQKHHQDMSRYRQRFSKAEAEVMGRAAHYSRTVPKVLVLLFLVVATVVMSVVAAQSYYFPENGRRRAAERDPAATCARMDAYLEEGDYVGFASYVDFNGLHLYRKEEFRRYAEIEYCASNYQSLILHLENMLLQTDREKWLKNSATYDIGRLCDTLGYFKESVASAERREPSADVLRHIEAMEDNVGKLMSLYFGIDEAELEDFLAMSANRQAAYMEEVILGE